MLVKSLLLACLLPLALANHWVDVWTAMPQLTEPANLPSGSYNATPKFANTTVRQIVKLDIPAGKSTRRWLRFRISNAFGTTQLVINSATIAKPFGNAAGTPAIVPGSSKALTFNAGNDMGVSIPDGALAISDPIEFDFAGIQTYNSSGVQQVGSLVTITLYLQAGQTGDAITSHPGSRMTTYLTNGDQTAALNITGNNTQSLAHWYFISAVESYEADSSSAFILIGDSITDGRGSTTDQNNRWPDNLFTRFQKSNSSLLRSISIENQAAGGNRVLLDGLGPSALSRVERDAIAQSGIKYALIFEGVNDIGVAAATADAQALIYNQLIAGYRQIISKLHAVNVPIFGATITPFGAPNSTLQAYSDDGGLRAATRVKVNNWIKTSGEFDGVVDFDAAIRDPANIAQLNPLYNSGDYLHPNVAGYQVLANAFPLGIFQKFVHGVPNQFV